MERPQLILSLRFNRAYQQRERRAYRCWAPVTGGKKHYTKTPLRKDFPSMTDRRDPSMLYCCSLTRDSIGATPSRAAGDYLLTDPDVDPFYP